MIQMPDRNIQLTVCSEKWSDVSLQNHGEDIPGRLVRTILLSERLNGGLDEHSLLVHAISLVPLSLVEEDEERAFSDLLAPTDKYDIFPGKLTVEKMHEGTQKAVRVECKDVDNLTSAQVYMILDNVEIDVTDRVLEVDINVDSVNNIMDTKLKLAKPKKKFLGIFPRKPEIEYFDLFD
jgi:hypothetical protein